MRQAALAAVVLWAPLAAGAADALQIAQIEQDKPDALMRARAATIAAHAN